MYVKDVSRSKSLFYIHVVTTKTRILCSPPHILFNDNVIMYCKAYFYFVFFVTCAHFVMCIDMSSRHKL